MATNVVELQWFISVSNHRLSSLVGQLDGGGTYEALWRDVGRGKPACLLIRVDDQPRRTILHPMLANLKDWATGRGRKLSTKLVRTTWFRRFAAPRPVGPAPIMRTSTLLAEKCQSGPGLNPQDFPNVGRAILAADVHIGHGGQVGVASPTKI